jgi:hypothetical protein
MFNFAHFLHLSAVQMKLSESLGLVKPKEQIQALGQAESAKSGGEPGSKNNPNAENTAEAQDQTNAQLKMQYSGQDYELPSPEGDYVKSPGAKASFTRVSHNPNDEASSSYNGILGSTSAWGALTTIEEDKEQEENINFGMTQLLNDEIKEPKKPFFATSWDELFASEKEADTEHFDALLNVFDSNGIRSTQVAATQLEDGSVDELCQNADARIDLTMLSQARQSKAIELQDDVVKNKDLQKAVEVACPGWKENIMFALHQDDKESVHGALDNLRLAKERMLETKRKILEAWERQNLALGVFEKALNTSLARIEEKSSNDDGSSSPLSFNLKQIASSPMQNSSQGTAAGKENLAPLL